MGSSALQSVQLTIALTSVSAHPYSHKQLNANRIRFSIASRLRSASFHALTTPASIGVSGGGGGGIQTSRFGGGGGGDGGSDSEVLNTSAAAVGVADEISDPDSEEFLILDVTGMTCGGCASSVKRILESQPKVSSAIVDLVAETATVWPIADVKNEAEWRKLLGQALATHLTNCGFQSSIRECEMSSKMQAAGFRTMITCTYQQKVWTDLQPVSRRAEIPTTTTTKTSLATDSLNLNTMPKLSAGSNIQLTNQNHIDHTANLAPEQLIKGTSKLLRN